MGKQEELAIMVKGNPTGRPKGRKDGDAAIRERQNRTIVDMARKKIPARRIADAVGMSHNTVVRRIRDFRQLLDACDNLPEFDANKGDLLSAGQWTLLRSMVDPEKLEKASVNNLAYAFTQLHTAGRLERNQSTSNNAVSTTFTKVNLGSE